MQRLRSYTLLRRVLNKKHIIASQLEVEQPGRQNTEFSGVIKGNIICWEVEDFQLKR
jgi:hypothetical protein